jgi:nitrite reductase/ring-hydroxylating ferredoxin subunit
MPKTLLKLADVKDVSPGKGKVVEAGGRSFALFNVDGTFFAIDNTCPHRGGPLGQGKLAGGVVTCPWHRAQFNVKTGAVCARPARTAVAAYPVKVEDESVYVELD